MDFLPKEGKKINGKINYNTSVTMTQNKIPGLATRCIIELMPVQIYPFINA
jgi:hypothetical protein